MNLNYRTKEITDVYLDNIHIGTVTKDPYSDMYSIVNDDYVSLSDSLREAMSKLVEDWFQSVQNSYEIVQKSLEEIEDK